MPTLKQLTCNIEHGSTQDIYREYGTTYGDGLVETFVCVPTQREPFAIHLTSNGYIAPGLAMFVYMDGVYQCNRNRSNLKFPEPGLDPSYTNVNFRVRQKEQKRNDGYFTGREWRFEGLAIMDDANQGAVARHFSHLGEIQVLVLRCVPTDGSHLPFLTGSDTSSYTAESEPRHVPVAPSPADERATPKDAFVTEVTDGIAGLGGFFDGPADYQQSRGQEDPTEPRPEYRNRDQNFGWSYTDAEKTEGVYGPQQDHGYLSHTGWTGQNVPIRHFPNDTSNGPLRKRHERSTAARPGSHLQNVHNCGPSQQDGTSWHPQGNGGFQDQRWNNVDQSNQQEYNSPSRKPQTWNGSGAQGSGIHSNSVRGNWNVQSTRPRGGPNHHDNRYGQLHDEHHAYWNGINHGPGHFVNGNNHDQNGGCFVPSMQGPPPFPQFPRPPTAAPPYYGYPPGFPAPYPYWPYPPPGNVYPPTPYLGQGSQMAPPTGYGGAQQWNNGNGQWHGETQVPNDEYIPRGHPPNNAREEGRNGGDSAVFTPENPRDATGGYKVQHDTGDAWGNNKGTTSGEQDWQQVQNGQGMGGEWQDNQNAEDAKNKDQAGWNNDNDENQFDSNKAPRDDWQVDQIAADGGNGHQPAWAPEVQENRVNTTDGWNAETTAPVAGFGYLDPKCVVGPYGPIYGSDHGDPDEGLEPEPLRYTVPRNVAEKKMTTHQVQPGKGHRYLHRVLRPKYLDSIAQPYAMFVFKYRSKEVVERTLGITIEESRVEVDPDAERCRLEAMTREQLIEHLLRERVKLTGTITSPAPGSGNGDIPGAASSVVKELQPPARDFLEYKSSLPKQPNAGLGLTPNAYASNVHQTQLWGDGDKANDKFGDDWGGSGGGNVAEKTPEQNLDFTPDPPGRATPAGAWGGGNVGAWGGNANTEGFNPPAATGGW